MQHEESRDSSPALKGGASSLDSVSPALLIWFLLKRLTESPKPVESEADYFADLVEPGWAEICEVDGVRVYAITDAGREKMKAILVRPAQPCVVSHNGVLCPAAE